MNKFTYRQLKKQLTIQTVGVFVGVLLAFTGCDKSTSVTTNAGGHPIHAVIAGDHSITSLPDHGTITSPFGKVTIERMRVKIDDDQWMTILETVPIEIHISKGNVWLHAGPVT